MADEQPNVLADGLLDFSGGVNSLKPTTVASEHVPNGMARNQLCWLVNGTVRGTGITPRAGWQYLTTVANGSSIYQGGGMYSPPAALPYLMVSIGGQIYTIRVDTDNSVVNVTPAGNPNPVNAPQAYFCQGEQFMVIQAGDNQTLPFFWDGINLRRSTGPPQNLGNNAIAFNAPGVGSLVQVTLASPYLGPVDQVVIIGGAHYQVVTGNSLTQVMTLRNRGDLPAGTNHPAGIAVEAVTPYNNSTASAVTYSAPYWLVNLASPHGFPIGNTFGIFVNGIRMAAQGTDATHVRMFNIGYGSPQSIQVLGSPIGSPVIVDPHFTSQVGTLKIGFNSPNVGSTVSIILTATYTGPLNIPVSIFSGVGTGSGLYEIVSVGFPPLPPNDILLINLDDAPGTPHAPGSILSTAPELPAATAMDYFMGRLWYAQGRTYIAGDIVGSRVSGSATYGYKDSILKLTENQLAVAGDGFTVPSNAGDIRALKHNAELDSTLGQGQLYIWTTDSIYRLNVPVSRSEWIAANDATQPRQTVAQPRWGSPADRSVVQVNADLFYVTLEPGVRSLAVATRYFQQWGNVPISRNENRVLRFNDRSMLRFTSGIQFDNRLFMLSLPRQTPVGVAFQTIIPLDFDLISTLEQHQPPAWEGIYEGLDFLQLFEGNFGGLQRAFAMVFSRVDGSIQLWELTQALRNDINNTPEKEARSTMVIEFPALTWSQEFLLKKLTNGELWIDRIAGTVDFKVEYRPDGEACWSLWKVFQVCSARTSCEDLINPVCYPIKPLGEGYREVISLGLPLEGCNPTMWRPMNIAYQIQVRITMTGFSRIRGLILYAEPFEKSYYDHLVCASAPLTSVATVPPTPPPPPPPPTNCITTNLQNTCLGSSYAGFAIVNCGTGPWTWSIGQGSLPSGLSGSTQPDTSHFVISGHSSVVGQSSFTLVAQDATGTISHVNVSISVMNITSGTPPAGQQGTSYSYTLTSAGGVAPLSYSVQSGSLPAGLTFNAATGVLSGTPTTNGTFNFSLCVQQQNSSPCCLAVSLSITAPGFGMPTITNTLDAAGFNWGQSCYASTTGANHFVFFGNSNAIKWVDNLTVAGGSINYGFPKNAFGMAYASSVNRVYADINNFPTIYLSVINPDTQAEVTTINNGQPYDFNYVKYASSIDRILTTQSDGTNQNIVLINPATNTLDVTPFSTDAANEFQGGIDYASSTGRLYVARQGSTSTTQTIRKFSFPLVAFQSFIDISPWNPYDLIYIPGFDLVAIAVGDFNTNAPAVLFLNPNTDTFTTLTLTGPNVAGMLVYDPHRQQLYIQCNLTLFVVNMSNTSSVLGSLTLDGSCNRASFNASNNKTYFPIIGSGTIDLVG